MMQMAEVEAVFASDVCLPICEEVPEGKERIQMFVLLGDAKEDGVLTFPRLCE